MRFNLGDRVRTYLKNPEGHTRLPAYLRGRVGRIERVVGAFPFSDERASGNAGAARQTLYTVCFAGRDVWGDDAQAASISADLFESYLEPLT
ncbi:MAG TPA: SH3-like domain-containing protein [Candidatus Baltobacteraceae bacterium]|jgi:nitrile hydratase|nr:SH3-like domain-containing protein [Candidatus Baltobacteraceae bacterium]